MEKYEVITNGRRYKTKGTFLGIGTPKATYTPVTDMTMGNSFTTYKNVNEITKASIQYTFAQFVKKLS